MDIIEISQIKEIIKTLKKEEKMNKSGTNEIDICGDLVELYKLCQRLDERAFKMFYDCFDCGVDGCRE
jgi:hypothetical protein